jgi:outer membrane autotransporter protein
VTNDADVQIGGNNNEANAVGAVIDGEDGEAARWQNNDNLNVNTENAIVTLTDAVQMGVLKISQAGSSFVIGSKNLEITEFDNGGGKKTLLGSDNDNGTLVISATNANAVVSEIKVGKLDFTTTGDGFDGDINVATFNIKEADDTIFGGAVKATAEVVIEQASKMTFAKKLEAGTLKFNANGTAVLNGGLTGEVDFDDNNDAKVTFGGSADSDVGSITTGGNDGNVGTVELNSTGTVTVAGATGASDGSEVKLINVGANAKGVFEGAVHAASLQFTGDGGTVKFENTANTAVNFKGKQGTVEIFGDKTLTGTVDSENTANTGTLKFTGVGGSKVTGAIGGTKALKEIIVETTDEAAVQIGVDNDVKAETLKINSAKAAVVAKIAGNFTGGVEFSNDGNDGGTLHLAGNDGVKTLTGGVKNTSGADKKGKILVDTEGAAITGDIGAKGSALKDVHANAKTLTLSDDKTAYAETFKFTGNGGQITVGENGELHATADAVGFKAENNDEGNIVFIKGGAIEGTIGAKSFAIRLVEAGNNVNAGVVTVGSGDHHVVKFKATSQESGFKFKDGANVTGAISTSVADQGSLEFEGTSTVTGKVGEEAKAFKTITVLGEEGKIVDFQDDVAANTLEINHKGTAKLKAGFIGELKLNNDSGTRTRDDDPKKDSRVVLHGNTAHALVGKITTNGKAPMGVIEIDSSVAGNSVTFSGAIGDIESDSAIALIQANQGFNGTLEFQGNSDVTKLEIASASAIKLNNGKIYKFGSISTGSNELVLNVVDGRVTLVGSSDATKRAQIGTADKKLGDIQFDNADSVLEVGENIDIAVNTISGTTNKGILEFKGNNILIGDTGSVNKVDVFGGANEPVRLKGKVVANDGMTINDSAVLEIEQDQASEIKAKANGNGTLRILNENGAIKITKKVGNQSALGTVEFAGQSVEFKESVSSNNFKFSGDSVKEVIFTKNPDITTSDFENNSNAIHTVILPEVDDITFAGKFKEGSNQIKFQIQEDKTTRVASSFGGAIFTTKDNRKGKLELNTGAEIYAAGEAQNLLESITFVRNNTKITKGAYASKITVGENNSAFIGGHVASDAPLALEANSTLSLLDGVSLESAVSGKTSSSVKFLGGGVVKDDIGSEGRLLKSVKFSDDNKLSGLSLGGNIYSSYVCFAAGEVKLDKEVKVSSGGMEFNGANVDLRAHVLNPSSEGGITFKGKNKIKTAMSSDTSDNKIVAGNIAISKGNLSYDKDAEFEITVNDQGKRPIGDNSRSFNIIDVNLESSALLPDINKVNVVGVSSMTRWDKKLTSNGSLKLTQYDNSEQTMKEIAAKLGIGSPENDYNFRIMAQAPNDSAADKIISLLDDVQKDEDKAKRVIVGLRNPTITGNEVLGISASSTATVSNRMLSVADVAAVAAGDADYKHGAWFNPFYNNTVQKFRKGHSGYGVKSYGASFGVDTKVNEDMVLGVAGFASETKMKHKDIKSGDTTDISSHMLSVYASYHINNLWSMYSVATVGINSISNNFLKPSRAADESVDSKYDAMSFNGEVTLSYKQPIAYSVVMNPIAGLRYSRVNGAGYSEQGSTTGQNLTVASKELSKLETLVGLRLLSTSIDMAGVPVTPEAHVVVNYNVLGNSQKQTVRVDGSGHFASASYKPARVSYNVGASFNAEYDMVEFGMGYDAQISDKRMGHQGNLKLRVSF